MGPVWMERPGGEVRAGKRRLPPAAGRVSTGFMNPPGLLGLQRAAGNRAVTLVVQRIEEGHAWIRAMPEGNRKLAMAENATSSDWLTKIGDFFVSKGFVAFQGSRGKVMAFSKNGTMSEAMEDARSFGMDLSNPIPTAKNPHTKQNAVLYGDRVKGMTLRPFSASSKDTVAAIDFMVGECRFEFKYLDADGARAAGHYGAAGGTGEGGQ